MQLGGIRSGEQGVADYLGAGLIPIELREKAEQTKRGRKASAKVRTILEWFDAQRRRHSTVGTIREALAEAGVRTEPDFEHAYIDERVTFRPIYDASPPEAPDILSDATLLPALEPEPVPARIDPTYRIGKLPSANKVPVGVRPDDPIRIAVTLMIRRDFSQLPVITGSREVKGMISWRSLGSRLALRKKAERVGEATERHYELDSDTSLFEAIPIIVRRDAVLIRDHTKAVVGIVTASDLSTQFLQLTEPFLLLNEVEDHLRFLVTGTFSVKELAAARDPLSSPRPVARAADLTLGEYLRLLEKPDNWRKLDLEVSRPDFASSLRRILDIRNDVMHFDPDGVEESQLTDLREFVGFLQRLQAI